MQWDSCHCIFLAVCLYLVSFLRLPGVLDTSAIARGKKNMGEEARGAAREKLASYSTEALGLGARRHE